MSTSSEIARDHGVLAGKVVIVTGGAQGMGRSHVERCAAAGAKVVATDLQEDAGRAVVAALGDSAVFLRHDVTSEDEWRSVVAAAVDRFGRIDGLVNNAAILLGTRPVHEETEATVEKTFRVNGIGTFLGIKAVVPALTAAGGGSIVNISSMAGIKGLPGFTAYGMSKWAVRGLTKTAAVDLGPLGIRVNSVHPGGIEGTGMFTGNDPDERARRAAHIPLRRHGTTDDVSDLVVHLLSDASSFITGVEHLIDGGASL